MNDFLIKELVHHDLTKELVEIGFDRSHANRASDKFKYKNFKIFHLTVPQAIILKQVALSVGADCGTHKQTITNKVAFSDCILGGNFSQLHEIAMKLQRQSLNLTGLGNLLIEKITPMPQFETQIMGVLNLTTDSFSDGGQFYSFEDATCHLQKLISDGADLIDLGAESTKPYSKGVDPLTQLTKLEPILNFINQQKIKIPISIDTRSSQVAERCIELGAAMINDVSGLDYDPKLVEILAKNPQVKVVLQHSKGTPEEMQKNPEYTNLMDEIYYSLLNKVNWAVEKGINFENIIIDPGIGFGKKTSHNLEIIQHWEEFKTIGCPVLIGLSRKRFLQIESQDNQEKDLYSLAFDSLLINAHIDYIRVHNVAIHKKFQKMLLGE